LRQHRQRGMITITYNLTAADFEEVVIARTRKE
jgi:hypothetical protein